MIRAAVSLTAGFGICLCVGIIIGYIIGVN